MHPGAETLRWMAATIETARCRTLTAADHARIDGYVGGAGALHELLGALLPLDVARWYESPVTAHGGTPMTIGHLAVPVDAEAIDVGWCCAGPALIVGPIGPIRVTTQEMVRPQGLTDLAWDEARRATSVLLRALLLGI